MTVIEFNIGSTPALLIGEKSEKVFLFVHGLHGNKEEALAFAEVAVPKGYQALFVSPILDMKEFVDDLSTCEDDYYGWVINNPITHWDAPLFILRPEVDLFVSEEVGRDFISRHQCHITIMPDGEHWFHTAKQLAFLKEWEESTVSP